MCINRSTNCAEFATKRCPETPEFLFFLIVALHLLALRLPALTALPLRCPMGREFSVLCPIVASF